MTLSLGSSGNSVSTFTFVNKTVIPVARGFGGCVGVGSILYVFGGIINLGLARTTSMYAYNTATDTWSLRTPMPVSVESPATAAIGTKIYAAGGNQFTAPQWTLGLYEYDTIAGTWATKAPIPTSSVPHHDVEYPAMCSIGTKLYLFTWDADFAQANLTIWDQATNTWTPDNATSSLPPFFDATPAVASAHNGFPYVIADMSNGGAPAARTFRFNPATHTYNLLTPMPGQTGGDQASFVVGATVDTMVYITGFEQNSGGATFESIVWRYEVPTDTWTTVAGRTAKRGIASIPVNTQGTMMGYAGGKIYAVGGIAIPSGTILANNWEMALPGGGGDLVLGGLALG